MGELVNLRRAKKAKARAAADEKAAANRAAHGTAKHVRDLTKKRALKSEADLDAHRIDRAKDLKE